MALFKVFKGPRFVTATATGQIIDKLQSGKPQTNDGWAYFTEDDGKFYIDITTGDNAIIKDDQNPGGNRVPLNAYKADTLSQTLPVSLGGTGATTVIEALENLGGLSLLKNGHSLNNTNVDSLEHGAYFSSNATATQTISGSVPFISGFTLYQIKGYAGQSKMQFASQGKKTLKFRYYSDSTWSNWETISMLSDIPTTLPASDVSDWAKADTKPSYYLSEILNATNINAIESITNTSGFLKKTGTNTWELDTNTYITSYTSQTKNYVLAAPSDSNGIPAFRKLVAADIPNLNASKINDGTLNFSRLPTMYWANIAITTNSSNTQTPIFGSITLNDTTLTKGVNLLTLSNNEVSYYTFRTESFGPTNNKSGQIDLGSSAYKWRNLYLAGDITAANTTLSGTLNVTGQSYLNNNVTVDGQITTNELIIQGQGSAQTPTAAQHIATKGYVDNAIGQGFAANDAMVFKGIISSSSVFTNILNSTTAHYSAGWTYRVDQNFTISNSTTAYYVEKGDLLIAIADKNTSTTNGVLTDWAVVEHNIDGGLYKSSTTFTDGAILLADGVAGKVKTGAITTTTVVTNIEFSAPTLGTAISADDITEWKAGNSTTAEVKNGVLQITIGTKPSLSYTSRSIPNITNVGNITSTTTTVVASIS